MPESIEYAHRKCEKVNTHKKSNRVTDGKWATRFHDKKN